VDELASGYGAVVKGLAIGAGAVPDDRLLLTPPEPDDAVVELVTGKGTDVDSGSLVDVNAPKLPVPAGAVVFTVAGTGDRENG
jgi:hypothetical protein